MSEFPSIPFFTDAYLADTRHLSTLEHGAYLLLLMMAWRQPDCRMPNDDDTLAKWAGVDARTWKRIKPRVMAFWTLAEDRWSQSRLSREREYVSKRAEVARKNGKQGGRPKSLETNGSENPDGSVRDSKPKAPSPSPKPLVIEPIAQQPIAASAAPKDLLDQLLEANGAGTGFREERNIGLMNLAPILGLIKGGFELERDILAAIRSKPNAGARTWGYFVPQIRDYVAVRDKVAETAKPVAPAEDWFGRIAVWRESRTWSPQWGPKPGEAGCKVPPELLRDAA